MRAMYASGLEAVTASAPETAGQRVRPSLHDLSNDCAQVSFVRICGETEGTPSWIPQCSIYAREFRCSRSIIALRDFCGTLAPENSHSRSTLQRTPRE